MENMTDAIFEAVVCGFQVTVCPDCFPLRKKAAGFRVSMTAQTWNGVLTMNRHIEFGTLKPEQVPVERITAAVREMTEEMKRRF